MIPLEEKIKNKTAKIRVVGLGYVGLPMLVEFAKAGFPVTGVDTDNTKINAIMAGTYFAENEDVKKYIQSHPDTINFYPIPFEFDVAIICVPSYVNSSLVPDLSHMISASESIARIMKKGCMVVLESTTYPTTLNQVIRPILEKHSFLYAGSEFYLVSSPERIDPGNILFKLVDIPKLVGGINDISTHLGCLLYSAIKSNVVPVDSPEIAEASKILENTYRLINISLINELAILFEKMHIDITKVISAATTKPFGYSPFYPGPGAGGHCIPVDPLYMSYISKRYGVHLDFIEHAIKINMRMIGHVIRLIFKGLNIVKKPVRGSVIGLLGASYKPDIQDSRNAPCQDIMNQLYKFGAKPIVIDPVVGLGKLSEISCCDCVVMLVKHSDFIKDRDRITRMLINFGIVFVDCVSFYDIIPSEIKYIGLGRPQ